MRNFHEQQKFRLKTIINRVNERVSVFYLFNLAIKTKISLSFVQ